MSITFTYRQKVDFNWYTEMVNFPKDGHIYHACMHTCVCAYRCMRIYTCTYVYCMHTYICTYVRTYMHTYIVMYTRMQNIILHTYVHTYVYACICIYIMHVCMYVYIYMWLYLETKPSTHTRSEILTHSCTIQKHQAILPGLLLQTAFYQCY